MKIALHFVSAIALTLPVAHAQYTFTSLGALPGGGPTPEVTANSMSSAGDVCGSSSVLGTTHGYLWKPSTPNGTIGAMIDLGAVPHPTGSNWSICTAVSTYAAVGFGYDPLDMLMSYRALVFAGGKFAGASVGVPYVLPIPAPPPTFTPNSYAYAINDSGEVAGTWTASAGVYHALVWKLSGTSFTVEDLNSPSYTDWVLNVATGVNKKGQVIGYGDYKGKTHAFLLTPGVGLTDLGSLTPAPFDDSVAMGINDLGQVVGYSLAITPTGMRHHAFLWKSGKMTDLGVPPAPGTPPALGAPITTIAAAAAPPSPFQNSVAYAINNNGKIVGWANTAPVATTLYTKTPFGWGTAVAFDTNVGATPPGLATGWNILSMPWVTAGAPAVPLGLPMGGAPPPSALIAAFAINDNDEIAGLFITPGPLTAGFLLTTPLPLKP